MADTEPQALPISDNYDVTAKPVTSNVLETTDAGLDDPGLQTRLGAEAALLKKVADETRGHETVAALIATDPDAPPRQTKGSGETEGSGEAVELSLEQVTFMGKLRERYEMNAHRLPFHDSVTWTNVENRLRANLAQLNALKQMDDSGGAPDVTGMEGEKFVFDEIAARLPKSRRNVTYAEAVVRAAAMGGGAKLMRPERYQTLVNDMGITAMDTRDDFVWLDSENPTERYHMLEFGPGYALIGSNNDGLGVVVREQATFGHPDYAFRCSILV